MPGDRLNIVGELRMKHNGIKMNQVGLSTELPIVCQPSIDSDDLRNGLVGSQVETMRERFGRNELSPPQKRPWWKDLVAGFQDPTIRILLVAALISVVITAIERSFFENTDAGYFDSLGIFLAVGLATLIAFFSQRKSDRAFELLNRIRSDIPIKVFRDGQIDNVPIAEIVVGDLIKIDAGDKIPADGVLISSHGILIDQSMMTGESIPVKKEVYREKEDIVDIRKSVKSDTPSFLARGTTVVDGSGLMRVLWVGDETQIGQIARKMGEQTNSENETPLVQKLSRLAGQISAVGVIGALAIFGVMTVEDLIQTSLWDSFKEKHTTIFLTVLIALAFALVSERFLLRHFFPEIGIQVRSILGRMAIIIPLFLALFTIGLGLLGMTGSPGQRELGIAILKETLMAFIVAVTIIVVAVPEGLPMMVTMSLALNMRKMVKQNCLVRRLVASETIGSATVICTDKTGTLTENQMKPGLVYLDGKVFTSEHFGRLKEYSSWERLAVGIALNCRAMLRFSSDGKNNRDEVSGVGNITESALLIFLYELGIDYRTVQKNWDLLFEVGHNSDRKMSLTAGVFRDKNCSFIKGAPEKILPRCTSILINGVDQPIVPQKEKIENILLTASQGAYRVLAFAEKTGIPHHFEKNVSENELLEESGFRFIGFVGLADPVRPEAAPSIKDCHNAHIEVKMITGDSPQTAKAVAESVGIPTDKPESVLTSAEFNEIPDERLSDTITKIRVLARATPFDKLRLVNALHRRGEVVAMTGDGINDAPALKAADVGISMGKNGTELAKDASDIVLIDDNFKSIVSGVLWGRTLFQNIRRFVQFQLSVNAAALICALIGPILHVPLPLTVTQLLWINIIMDTFAALALSTEPPRPQTLKKKPTPRSSSIITGTMGLTILSSGIFQSLILFLALFGGWFVDADHCYDPTIPIADPRYLPTNRQALTVFFTLFVMFQFWHTFNCRSLRADESGFRFVTQNSSFIFIIATIAIVQIVMVQIPFVGKFFRTEPLNLRQWLSIILVAFSVIPFIKICRLAANLFLKSRPAEEI